MTSLGYCLLTAGSISLISLSSSWLYRKEPEISSGFMTLVSFLPGILIGLVGVVTSSIQINYEMVIALIIKNSFYSLSFYLRYESLRRFGPFVGALMLGTQPIMIFILGFFILGEFVTHAQMLSLILVAGALTLLANQPAEQGRIKRSDFIYFYIVPTLASTLALVWDRYFLREKISGSEFFILDRLSLLPALIVTFIAMNRKRGSSVQILLRSWPWLALIASLFTISIYTYNLALKTETAATVGIFRNSAYPLAAFLGALLFRQKTSAKQWMSFILVGLAIFSASF